MNPIRTAAILAVFAVFGGPAHGQYFSEPSQAPIQRDLAPHFTEESQRSMDRYWEAQAAAEERRRLNPLPDPEQVLKARRASWDAQAKRGWYTLAILGCLVVAGLLGYRALTRTAGTTNRAALAASDPWVRKQLANGQQLPLPG